MKIITTQSLAALTLSLFVFGTLSSQAQPSANVSSVVNSNITESDVESVQKAWGAALIQISQDYKKGGIKKATSTAKNVLENAYGYRYGSVLFKPTLTSGEQTFRTTQEGALAYFVGANKDYPNDSGFALKNWEKYEFKNAGIVINGDMAITMGNVYLTDGNGKVTKVDKTWGFKKFDDGKIRIVLHHSSLPYQPAASN